MNDRNRTTEAGRPQESFDSAIKTALRRGLESKSGEEGARQRLMGKGKGRWSIWNVGVSGLMGTVSKRDVFALCQQLAVLLECGMPLVKALNTLSQRTHNPTLARTVMDIGRRVEEGSTFSDAVALHSRVFPPVVVNVFRAGELSGTLVEALHRVAEHGERLTLVRHKAYAAMIYPVILLLLAMAVVAFAFSFTVGQLAPIFESLEVPMPPAMGVLLAAGEAFRSPEFWGLAVAAVVGVVVLYKLACLLRVFRLLRDRAKLRLPAVRYYAKQGLVANFARVFATLYRSGVPLLDTLQATHDTTRNEVLKLGIERVMDAVRQGGRMSESLEQADVFPPLAYDLIAVGEEAGALDRVCLRLADYYEEKIAADTALLGKVVQPLVVVFLACVVGFILVAFFSMYTTLLDHVP